MKMATNVHEGAFGPSEGNQVCCCEHDEGGPGAVAIPDDGRTDGTHGLQ